MEDNYHLLKNVLERAYKQATDPEQKGQVRHGEDLPIEQQTTLVIGRVFPGFPSGQAAKKIFETPRLPTVKEKVHELLGAMIYIAFEIINYEARENKPKPSEPISIMETTQEEFDDLLGKKVGDLT